MPAEKKAQVDCIDLFDKCFSFTAADEVIIDGQECIMIGSNNYLGLVGHPKVKEAAINAVKKFGSGCTGSPFLNGTLDLHLELQHRLAKFVGSEDALVFSTGFQTNLGTVSCLAGKNDALVIDRQVHACIVDACRL